MNWTYPPCVFCNHHHLRAEFVCCIVIIFDLHQHHHHLVISSPLDRTVMGFDNPRFSLTVGFIFLINLLTSVYFGIHSFFPRVQPIFSLYSSSLMVIMYEIWLRFSHFAGNSEVMPYIITVIVPVVWVVW
jgi:hypothetical protein